MLKPRSDLVPNTADYENQPLVTANGFREYDARWLFGKEINLWASRRWAWVLAPICTTSA